MPFAGNIAYSPFLDVAQLGFCINVIPLILFTIDEESFTVRRF